MSKSTGLIMKLRRIMTGKYKIILGVLVGAALGAAAVQGLHAQAKPKAYIVTESEVLDPAALAAYTPQAQAAAKAAGGRPGVVPAGGKIVALVGEPPKRFGVSEWESLEKAQAWYNSSERKALTPQRNKAQKVVRQFIVEGPAHRTGQQEDASQGGGVIGAALDQRRQFLDRFTPFRIVVIIGFDKFFLILLRFVQFLVERLLQGREVGFHAGDLGG